MPEYGQALNLRFPLEDTGPDPSLVESTKGRLLLAFTLAKATYGFPDDAVCEIKERGTLPTFALYYDDGSLVDPEDYPPHYYESSIFATRITYDGMHSVQTGWSNSYGWYYLHGELGGSEA
jgi:hypothetical protein